MKNVEDRSNRMYYLSNELHRIIEEGAYEDRDQVASGEAGVEMKLLES
jgi:hypothetical protein